MTDEPHIHTSRLWHLARAYGGVAKLSEILGLSRATFYRYIWARIDAPLPVQITCNLLAKKARCLLPFKDQDWEKENRELYSLLKKRVKEVPLPEKERPKKTSGPGIMKMLRGG